MKITVCCNDWIRKDNGYICALANKNAICMFDGKKTHYLYSTKDRIDAGNLFSGSFRYFMKTVFVPFRAKVVVIYDEAAQEFPEIDVTSYISINKMRPVYFRNAFIYQNILYMISNCTNEMVLLNLDTENIEKVTFSNLPANCIGEIFSSGNALNKDKVYLPIAGSGALVQYSLKNSKFSIIDAPGNMTEIYAISMVGESLLIWGMWNRQKCLISWNVDTNEYIDVESGITTAEDMFELYHPPVFWDGEVYIFAYTNNMNYVVDLKNKECKEFIAFNALISAKDNSSGLFNIKQDGSILTFQTKTSHMWGKYDLENGEIKWRDPDYLDDKRFIDRIEAHYLKKDLLRLDFVSEDVDKYGLRTLINVVAENEETTGMSI